MTRVPQLCSTLETKVVRATTLTLRKNLDDLMPEVDDRFRWREFPQERPTAYGGYLVIRKENSWPTSRLWDGAEWESRATVTHWRPIDWPEPKACPHCNGTKEIHRTRRTPRGNPIQETDLCPFCA